jgi:ABC-type transport system involved in cytochrome c biogenesis permease subunit
MVSSLVLLLIGIIFKDSNARKWTETLISTILISTMTSMMFPLMFLWIAELFPTKIRGLSTAVILFLGKLLGGLAPLFSSICEKHGIHVLVGCSSIGIFSLLATGYMRETYDPSIEDAEKYRIRTNTGTSFSVKLSPPVASKNRKISKQNSNKNNEQDLNMR